MISFVHILLGYLIVICSYCSQSLQYFKISSNYKAILSKCWDVDWSILFHTGLEQSRHPHCKIMLFHTGCRKGRLSSIVEEYLFILVVKRSRCPLCKLMSFRTGYWEVTYSFKLEVEKSHNPIVKLWLLTPVVKRAHFPQCKGMLFHNGFRDVPIPPAV